MWLWILLGVGAVSAFWWLSRAGELFFLSVRDGSVLLVRGRIPPSLLNDFGDAVRHVRRGSIRGVRQMNGGQVFAGGDIDEFVEQRLRNILRTFPVSRLRSAPGPANPTLGQVLGIAWLAWLLDRAGGGPLEG